MTMSIEPVGQALDDFARFLAACRIATATAIAKGNSAIRALNVRQVLLGQDRGRHEHGHLVAGVDRLERRPHRHFGLAVADVAAQQAIHRPRLLHVAS